MDREPSVAHFRHIQSGKTLHFASVHLVPSGKGPQHEVQPLFEALKDFGGPMIVAGDFNLAGEHPYFKTYGKALGFENVFQGTDKSSLSSKKTELSKAYDNFFIRGFAPQERAVLNLYDKKNGVSDLGPKDMYQQLSDHCPIRMVATFN